MKSALWQLTRAYPLRLFITSVDGLFFILLEIQPSLYFCCALRENAAQSFQCLLVNSFVPNRKSDGSHTVLFVKERLCDAKRVVLAHGGEIDDLYTVMKDTPESYHSDPTHFNTKEGTRRISEAVISSIEKALGIQAQSYSFDALWNEKIQNEGI